MLYQKNLPSWERVLRVIIGLSVAVAGMILLRPMLWGYIAAASGAGIVLTGFVGFCPMCALVGRRLASKAK